MFAGHVVSAQNQYPPAAAGANPVLGDGDSLRRAGAGGVDMGVGAASTDVLCELAVAHSQDTEDKTAVELIRLALQQLAQVGDAPADFLQGARIGCVAA